jgi:hypothetical protein
MIQPGISHAVMVFNRSDETLSYNRPNFPRRSANAMCRRPVAGGKNFPRHNKGSGIRTKILEEIAETVECKEAPSGDLVEAKANDAKEDCENDEAADLDRFATESVYCCDRDPISWNKTGSTENEIAGSVVV